MADPTMELEGLHSGDESVSSSKTTLAVPYTKFTFHTMKAMDLSCRFIDTPRRANLNAFDRKALDEYHDCTFAVLLTAIVGSVSYAHPIILGAHEDITSLKKYVKEICNFSDLSNLKVEVSPCIQYPVWVVILRFGAFQLNQKT